MTSVPSESIERSGLPGSASLEEPALVQVFTQWTPNPNAFKFIVSEFVIDDGKASFSSPTEAVGIPLIETILALPSVRQVHLYENILTITQDGDRDWAELSEEVEEILKRLLPTHNPKFDRQRPKSRAHMTEEVRAIDEILERTIRPGLQGDGGDVEVVSYDRDAKILSIHYEGACGTCPSSLAGTLQAITGFLRDEFDPEIEVVTV